MQQINELTPATIGNGKYRIPLYQRLFEWEDEQLKGLLEDLKGHFDSKGNTPYYIGMMTGCKKDDSIDLVDGQQRFTTMMLMGIIMRHWHEEWEHFTTPERLNFVARENDKNYLEDLIGNRDSKIVNAKMQRALQIISQYLATTFGNDADRKEYCQYVYEHLTFFVAELPDNYSSSPKKLNKYFETMNSAGRSLEQHEKIKVELLKNCPEGQPKPLFTKIWNSVERMNTRLLCTPDHSAELNVIDAEIDKICRSEFENLDIEKSSIDGDKENRQKLEDIMPSSDEPKESGQVRRDVTSAVDFQELLLLALNFTLNAEKPLDKYKLEESFKGFPAEKIPEFYYNLYKIRLLLDRYVIRIEKENNRNIYRIHLSDDDEQRDKEREMEIIQYQSMLYVSTSVRLWLTPYLEWLMEERKAGKRPDPKVLLDKLKEIDNGIHPKRTLPPVEEMAYDRGIDRYWFWRLDYYLWERCEEDKSLSEEEREIISKYTFRANRSIEHLHPQNQENNTEWSADDVNSFGNLALISTSFNSQQSNDPVGVKFARVENQVRNHDLESLKMYKMYLKAKKVPGGWEDLDVKNKHQEEMYAMLENSYDKQQ